MAKWSVAIEKVDDGKTFPGDIIAFKPFENAKFWSRGERASFHIVIFDNLTVDQMHALTESYYDTKSFPTEKDMYEEGKFDFRHKELLPQLSFAKRRFKLVSPTTDMEAARSDIWDKLNERVVNISDNLSAITPLVYKPKVLNG